MITQVLVLFGFLALGCVMEFGTTCPCRRDGGFWFGPRHPRSWMMLLLCSIITVCIIASVFGGGLVALLLNTLFAFFHWGRWWKHESGKWKRRAAKAAGHVAFNQHGRLVVEP